MTMKQQIIKLETKVLLRPSKYALFKYGWKYTEIIGRRGFWSQDLDKDGNPIHTKKIGIHEENLFEILSILLLFAFAFELMYILMTFPYPTF